MKYALLLLLPILAISQVSQVPILGVQQSRESEYGIGFRNLGEDTEIVMTSNKDTVYTIDDEVLDIRPDKIALNEMYYPLDAENVVVIGMAGKVTSLEDVPIKGTVRAKLVEKNGKFVVVRIRVLKGPPMK